MVIITKKNIVQQYPIIKEELLRGCMLSIDCEFSALHPKYEQRALASDDLDIRLEKCILSAKKTELLQFAFTIWTPVEEKEKTFKHKTYTFLTFSNKNDAIFMGSSVELLCDSGIDFNTIFRDGLGYAPSKMKIRQMIKQDAHTYFDKKYKMCKENLNEDQERVYSESWMTLNTFLEKDHPEEDFPHIILQFKDMHVMRVIYSELTFEYKDRVYPICLKKSYSQNVHQLKCVLMDATQNTKQQINHILEKEMLLQYGLTPIIRLIQKSRLPIVVHNGMLDLAHIVCKCLETPKTVEHFKKVLRSTFSKIIDTKVVITDYKILDQSLPSHLGGLYDALESNIMNIPSKYIPRFEAAESLNGVIEKRKHNAGYDSLMTGCVYWHLVNIVNLKRRESKENPAISFLSNRIYQVAIPETLNLHEKKQSAGDRSSYFLALNVNSMKHFNVHSITSFIQHLPTLEAFFKEAHSKRVMTQMITKSAAMIYIPYPEAAHTLREALYNDQKYQMALYTYAYAKKNHFLYNLLHFGHYSVSERASVFEKELSRKRKHSKLVKENPIGTIEQETPEKQARYGCILM